MQPYATRFGIQVVKDVSAGELVNPCKSNEEVVTESNKGSELYKKSHGAYGVGKGILLQMSNYLKIYSNLNFLF